MDNESRNVDLSKKIEKEAIEVVKFDKTGDYLGFENSYFFQVSNLNVRYYHNGFGTLIFNINEDFWGRSDKIIVFCSSIPRSFKKMVEYFIMGICKQQNHFEFTFNLVNDNVCDYSEKWVKSHGL